MIGQNRNQIMQRDDAPYKTACDAPSDTPGDKSSQVFDKSARVMDNTTEVQHHVGVASLMEMQPKLLLREGIEIKLVRKFQYMQAERMFKKSSRYGRAISVGDKVAVPIPNTDRGQCEAENLQGE